MNLRKKKETALATVDEYHKPNEKKWVAAVVGGLSILSFAMMTTSNVIGLIAEATECCGIAGYEDICDKRDEYTSKVEAFDALRLEVNEDYTSVQNLDEVLDETYYAIDRVFTRLNGLDTAGGHVIYAVDSELYEAEHNLTAQVLAEIEAEETAYSSFDDLITDKYDTSFTGLWVDLYKLKSFYITPTYYLVAPILKRWIVNRMATQSATSGTARGFTRYLQMFTGNSRVQAVAKWIQTHPNYIAAFKGIISAIMIGLDIYSIYTTLNECSKFRDKIQGHIDDIDEASSNLTATQNDILEVYANYTEYYGILKGEVTTDNFTSYLEEIIAIGLNSSEFTNRLDDAAADIQEFVDTIDGADYYLTVTMLNQLENAVAVYIAVYYCYAAKFEILSYMYDKCSAGGYLTLDELYALDAVKMNDSCNAFEYMDLESAKEAAVSLLYEDNYYQSCTLNNDATIDTICTYRAEGYTIDEITAKIVLVDMTGESPINETELQEVLDACPLLDVSPANVDDIAANKALGKSLSYTLTKYSLYNQTQVEQAYNDSDYATLTSSDQEQICDYKYNDDLSLDVIYSTYYNTAYSYTEVETVYNECEPPALTSGEQSYVCFLATLGWSNPAQYFEEQIAKYGNNTVFEHYNTCLSKKDSTMKLPDKKEIDDKIRNIFQESNENVEDVKKSMDDELTNYQKILKSNTGTITTKMRDRFSRMNDIVADFKARGKSKKNLSKRKAAINLYKQLKNSKRDLNTVEDEVSSGEIDFICTLKKTKSHERVVLIGQQMGLTEKQTEDIAKGCDDKQDTENTKQDLELQKNNPARTKNPDQIDNPGNEKKKPARKPNDAFNEFKESRAKKNLNEFMNLPDNVRDIFTKALCDCVGTPPPFYCDAVERDSGLNKHEMATLRSTRC